MPYTRFVRRVRGGEKVVDVYKRTPGGEVKAFTSHSASLEEAHRKAAIRESHAQGSMRNRRRVSNRGNR
jgi:hypothetical protein